MLKTRRGRIVKKPEKYEPQESNLADDFNDEEYDSGAESDVSSTVEYSDDDGDDSDDSFICGSDDDVEYEEDETDTEEEDYNSEDATSDEEN